MRTLVRTVALVTLAVAPFAATPAAAQSPRAYVTRVVDGDTLYAELGGRIEAVRYIGINTPVVDHPSRGREPYVEVVREMNRRLVEGKWVRLVFEAEPRDAHGRLLAYVWVRDVFVNAALLHWGFAEAATPSVHPRYAEYFRGLEEGARRDARGLWRYADVRAYHRPGGSETDADDVYQQRAATAAGGRVFSAPAPFLPSLTPSPAGSSSASSPSIAVPAAPPVNVPTRSGTGGYPRGGATTTMPR